MSYQPELSLLLKYMSSDGRVGSLPGQWAIEQVAKHIESGDLIEAAYELGAIGRSWSWSVAVMFQIRVILDKMKGER